MWKVNGKKTWLDFMSSPHGLNKSAFYVHCQQDKLMPMQRCTFCRETIYRDQRRTQFCAFYVKWTAMIEMCCRQINLAKWQSNSCHSKLEEQKQRRRHFFLPARKSVVVSWYCKQVFFYLFRILKNRKVFTQSQRGRKRILQVFLGKLEAVQGTAGTISSL